MISHKHKTIFIHIPKCGGQSIETLFLRDLGLDYANRDALNLRLSANTSTGPKRIAHLTLAEYESLHYTHPDQLRQYFVFSVVRDPLERAYSLYHWIGRSRYVTFDDFAENEVPALSRSSEHRQCWPQTPYLTKEMDGLIDSVHKLEDFEKLAIELSTRLGPAFSSIPHVNGRKDGTNGRHDRPAVKKPWQRLRGPRASSPPIDTRKLLSPAGLESIQSVYEEDYRRFGYELQGPTS